MKHMFILIFILFTAPLYELNGMASKNVAPKNGAFYKSYHSLPEPSADDLKALANKLFVVIRAEEIFQPVADEKDNRSTLSKSVKLAASKQVIEMNTRAFADNLTFARIAPRLEKLSRARKNHHVEIFNGDSLYAVHLRSKSDYEKGYDSCGEEKN